MLVAVLFLAAGCQKKVTPEIHKPSPSAASVLVYRYSGNRSCVPEIRQGDGKFFRGQVIWEKGTAPQSYAADLKHVYANGDMHEITIQGSSAVSVHLEDLSGFKSLDFSRF